MCVARVLFSRPNPGSDNSNTDLSHDKKNIEVYKYMDESSDKEKEYTAGSEEIKTLIQNLMKLNSQKNVIRFTLTNILYFDENMNKAKKYDVKIKTYEMWNYYKSATSWYLFITYHCLPLWYTKNKKVMIDKEILKPISSCIYVKY